MNNIIKTSRFQQRMELAMKEREENKNMKEEVKVTDPVEKMIAIQLSQLEVKPEELEELAKQYSQLTIIDINDKQGRKAVSEARKFLKSKRTSITRDGKLLRENFNKVSKAIIVRVDELVNIIEPQENRLEAMEDDIEKQEQAIIEQRNREEQEKITARTELLFSYGASFNGVQYQLGDHTILVGEVKLFTNTEFDRAATFFKEYYENFEQLKLQAEIDRQTSLTNNKEAAMLHIQSLGYVFETNSFYNSEFNHRFTTIRDLETEDDLNIFKREMDNLLTYRKEEKEKAESKRIADEALKAEQDRLADIRKAQELKQAELDRKQKELDDQLAAVQKQKEADEKRAKQLEYDAKVNLFESRRTQLMNTPNLVQKDFVDNINHPMYVLNEEDWTLFLHGCKIAFNEEQERLTIEAEEAAAAEEKRRIEMAPDVEVLNNIANEFKKILSTPPTMKTEKGRSVVINTNQLKNKIITYIEEQIKNL